MMTIIKFIAFIVVFVGLLFGAHYLLYTSFIRFMGVSDPGIRRTVFWIVVCLALSFFPSVILLRIHVNIATTLFYLIACIWLGLFLYLLMGTGLLWVIFGLGKGVGAVPNMRIIGMAVFLLAVGFSSYGIWRARFPVVKPISVQIQDLPDTWKGKTIVQLSDVHLGAINGPGFMKRVTETVNSLEPDLILITGDLFDGMGGDLQSFIEPINNLKTSKGIYFVTGNHEGYLGLEKPLDIIDKTQIKVLDDQIVEVDGLQIIGISFPEHNRKNVSRQLLNESGAYDAKKPSILMYHTPTSIEESNTDRGSQQAKTYWFPDTRMLLAKELGIDLQLSGHTHQGQLFPFIFLTRLIYKGYDYGLHQVNGFQIFISSGTGTWGPPMRSGSRSEIVSIRLH
ncbi:MAG: metallophosphoesterase [Deltaproteobacteria bacterium]|nr:metallophosphoesterase [Deltaproteobacteria bacterium]